MDDKKTIILKAAMHLITAYGFKRTSMEDIAQEAGVSRPAIYQLFRGKDDVFLSALDMVINEAFDVANSATQGTSSTKAKVTAYVSAYIGYYHTLLVAGRHGQELLDLNSRLGGDKTKEASVVFVAKLNQMLGQAPDAEAGQVLCLAASGIKYQTADAETLMSRLAMLVDRFVD